jgi:Glycogen recognition site of AMP-activated protein kinase
MTLDPLLKRLLDGDIALTDLPPELREEGVRLLRMVRWARSEPVGLSPLVEERVMAAVRQRVTARRRSVWRWLFTPHDVHVRLRPWVLGPTFAAVVLLAVLLGRSPAPEPAAVAQVRLVFYAPSAHAVSVAGSFNDWSSDAAPLARGTGGVWTITLALPAGQHQYAFVVDGTRWEADPSAPAVDDGFGRRNSVLDVGPPGTSL